MNQARRAAGWSVLLLVGCGLVRQATAQPYFYFGTNQFVVYEGGTINGKVYRSSAPSAFDLCILVNTNVSGITPLKSSDMNGLVTGGACYQPYYKIVLAHFNAGALSASFSLGINQNGAVDTERGAALMVGPEWGAPPAPPGYIQTAWVYAEDNDRPVMVSRYTPAVPEGLVNHFFFDRSTNCLRAPLTVRFTLSGSATLNADYQISAPAPFTLVTGTTNQLTIPEGYDYGQVNVTMLRDSLVESDETITARIEPNSAQYTMPGTPTSTITNWDDTPAVSVALINPDGVEGGSQIGVKLRRSYLYSGGNSISVDLSIGGTATGGTDYTPSLPMGVTIPSGQYATTNWITPLADANVEGVETVSVTVLPGNYYVVDAQSNAVAHLEDDYPVITVKADDDYAAATSGDTGSFLITRIGNYSKAVTVQFNVTGSAVAGTDYAALATDLTLGAGVYSTNLMVTPIANGSPDPARTVVVSLKTNASYLLGLYTNAEVTIASEVAVARNGYPKSERYQRGSGTNLDLQTMVIPLDGIHGTRRKDVEALGYTMAYHYNATNTSNPLYATNRIPFNTPIVSFGEQWGTPLYLARGCSLGVYAGVPTTDPIIIDAFRRTDGRLEGTTSISFPNINSVADWTTYATNGFAKSVVGHGLTTVLRTGPDLGWGARFPGLVLTHTATDAATNYVFVVSAAGVMNSQSVVINAANQPAYGYLYELKFGALPGWRSVFIDQPHFQGSPLPPDLWNKTPDELLNYGAAVNHTVSLSPSACTNLDQSPELRRHPILDQFVADLNRDPLALANYVQNEIELTDPLGYREDGQIEKESINQGGVNRGALGVYLEGQGSPTEQCALLIYFLRQAGYPATYVFPPENGLKLLDTRLSALLRMRVNGAHDALGRVYTTNQLIAVNYPWVATYISNQWVHIFPWLKDHSVEEGLNLDDYLPDPYKQTQLWVKDYVLGKTNLMAFATLSDDTPSTIFPRWLDHALKQNAPGISLDDIGMCYVNRRHLYARWSDLPRPTWVTNTSTAVESLGVGATVFDTIQVQLGSVANPQKNIQTPPMRMADLHNRKFFLTHTNTGNGQVQAHLILGPYLSGNTNQGNFSPSDTALTNKQMLTLAFDDTDDRLNLRIRHRRQRTIAWETALQLDTSFLNLSAQRELLTERPLRKGDSAAICLNPGRVTPAMLRVHAQELWNLEQMLSTNSVATNQVSVDVYQGSLLYLAGMSYYERAARSATLLQDLFKVRTLSRFAMGLSKLGPRRNANGTLYHGPLDPIWPNVDMFFSDTALTGNGMARQDSGWTLQAAKRNYQNLSTADLSAQEHAVLDIFFGQSNSVSTVKLLQQAQTKVASGGSNLVEVSLYNLHSAGTNVYNGKALRDHDPEIWSQVVDAFLYGGAPDAAAYTVGWLTPGDQTAASGAFSGMAAFVLAPYLHVALIGDNQNGGYANPLPYNSVSAANAPFMEIRADAEGNYRSSYSAPSANQRLPGSEVTTTFDLLSDYYAYNNSAYVPNPNQSLEGILSDLMLSGTSGVYPNSLQRSADLGALGTKPDYRSGNGMVAQVEDPVNALTGEFYIDEVDLSLPGPMPLQVRRNYGSQNLTDNQLGFGWKVNYMPYLSVAASNIIYVADADGSVLAFNLTGSDTWSPTLALNPTLNNNSANGIGSVANRLNARLTKVSASYFLKGGDGSLRVFQELSFPLTNSASWDRFRPYLTHWYDNRGNFYRFEYGTNALAADYGQVRRVVGSSGNILRFEYDVYARIVNAYSADGRRVQYDYDHHGDLVTVTRPDTSEINYEYELKTWSTNSVTNVYSTHLLVKELKPDGRALKNEYDGQRRVTNQWSTVGPDLRLVRNATFRYTNDFNLSNLTATISGTTTILDYTNNATTYFYTNSLIRRIRDPLGAELVQTWYEANETTIPAYPRSLKTLTDKRGLTTTFYYDPRGNVTNSILRGDLLGDENTNTTAASFAFYDTNNLPTRTVDASGTTNVYFYTNTWLLARMETWPRNAVAAQAITNLYSDADTTNAADGTFARGLRAREVRAALSPDAATLDWVYSSRGFPIQQVRYTGTDDPVVTVTNFYNTRGELAQQTDAAGHRTTFGYDPLGHLQSREVYPAGQTIPAAWEYYYYNENGELTWSDGPRFDPEDYAWRDYDGAGRKTQEIHWRSRAKTDGTGVEAAPGDDLYATAFYEYDPMSSLTRVTDPRGNYSRKKYDALGRLTREEFYSASGTLLATNGYAYNAAGDVTSAFNGLGGSAQTFYTSTGKPRFQRHADGSTNAWRYYADGRLQREFQNNGAYWETTYDDANRRMTRKFFSATGTPLATNVAELDRRQNVIRTVDAAGSTFTNHFDGLDRLKWTMGPKVIFTNPPGIPAMGDPPPPMQQAFTNFYDAAGRALTNVNALGERTITRFDALGRATRTEIYSVAGALIRQTSVGYAQNHHSQWLTNGSGSDALVATAYTDNQGRGVLSVAYPHANVREFTLRDYDASGDEVFSGQYAATNTSPPALYTGALSDYDGLNRLSARLDRDGALTTFAYDPLGNLTNQTLPGGLQWRAEYNRAGQLTTSFNQAEDASVTRMNTYTYYSSNHVFAGLPLTHTDGRGVVRTAVYDDFLRLLTNTYTGSSHEHKMTTVWRYDARGLVTNVTENFTLGGTGPTTSLRRTYDPYGLLASEAVWLDDTQQISTALKWDSAGRRDRLYVGNFLYGFGWRADGLLGSGTAGSGFNAATTSGRYGYNTAGLGTNRTVNTLAVNVTSRDGAGRVLAQSSKVDGTTRLSETLTWTGDGLLAAHALARTGDYTDNRSYDYADYTRRLATERLKLDGTKGWTNVFTYDTGAAGGPGVLTKVAEPNSGGAAWTASLDGFDRIARETNNVIRRMAYGRMNGPVAHTLNVTLDGRPLPLNLLATGDPNWPAQWRSVMELRPGAHTLLATATHSSGQFTTNKTTTFTNNAVDQTALSHFAEGQLSYRVWKNAAGTVTNRIQTFTWDAKSRLIATSELDASNNGYNWSAVYDPFGRRLRTTTIIVTNGVALNHQPRTINQFFDPSVEFLELGVELGGKTTMKVYGPDLDGSYGGMNGTGGLDGVVDDLGIFHPVVADARGNVHGAFNSGTLTMLWNASRPTGYGAVPEYRPLPLADSGQLWMSVAWRGRWPDLSGFYWLGARYYDPVAGRFISCDPYGHDADPSLYGYAGGDPINFFDPDGRLGKALGMEQEAREFLNNVYNGYVASQAAAGFAFAYGGDIGSALRANGFDEFLADAIYAGKDAVLNTSARNEARDQIAHRDFSTGWGRATYVGAVVSYGANTVDAAFNAIPLVGTAKGLVTGGIKAGVKELVGVGAKEVAEVGTKEIGQTAAETGALFRRTSNLGEFSGLGVNMSKQTVLRYAEQGGVGLEGVTISINRQSELIGSGLFGSAGRGNRIALYPDAFSSPETLIRTLGHERTHLMQYQLYGIGNVKGALRSGMENSAYRIEDAFVDYWRMGGGR